MSQAGQPAGVVIEPGLQEERDETCEQKIVAEPRVSSGEHLLELSHAL